MNFLISHRTRKAHNQSLIIPLEISTRMRVNVLCILVFSLSLKFSTSVFSF
jgi:hypothetical protein